MSSSSSKSVVENVVTTTTTTRSNKRRRLQRRKITRSSHEISLVSILSILIFQLVLLIGNDLFSTIRFVSAIPDLPLGDINLVVLTDLHSWIGGNPHKYDSNYDDDGHYDVNNNNNAIVKSTTTATTNEDDTTTVAADLGDVLSFYEHLKRLCTIQKKDLWLILNGDWIYGTGLAMNGDATHLLPLLKQVPWDIVTMGTQEIKQNSIVSSIATEFKDTIGNGFVTSNILLNDNHNNNNNNNNDLEATTTFGSQYQLLHGNYSTVLTFGFINDDPTITYTDYSDLITIQSIEITINSTWFENILLQKDVYDAILIVVHMDIEHPKLLLIVEKIRSIIGGGKDDINGGIPIQFITGSSHKRNERKIYDLWSHGFEAGSSLDTIGFMSFPNHYSTTQIERQGLAKTLFQHKYITPNKLNLQLTLGGQYANGKRKFQTSNGMNLSNNIRTTQQNLGLTQIIGCPPQDYYKDKSLDDNDSLWRLYHDSVIPKQFFVRKKKHNYIQHDNNQDSMTSPYHVMYVSSKSWHYDLRSGTTNTGDSSTTSSTLNQLTVDDVIAVAPYNRRIIYIGKIPAWVLFRIQSSLNVHSAQYHEILPDYVMVGEVNAYTNKHQLYKLFTHDTNVPEIVADLHRLLDDGSANMEQYIELIPTEYTDTTLWLEYIQTHWQCPNENNNEIYNPWWVHEKSSNNNNDINYHDNEKNNEDKNDDDEEEEQQQQQFYISSSSLDDIDSDNDNHHNHYRRGHRHSKIHRRIKITIMIIIATICVIVPIYSFIQILMGNNLLEDDFDDHGLGSFYDQEEIVSLKYQGEDPDRPTEIELT